MSQYIGLILLIIAAAAGLYLVTHKGEISMLRIEVPELVRPQPISPSLLDGGVPPSAGEAAVVEKQKPARISYASQTGLRLSANVGRNETANITGWFVKSNSGSFTIPQAQEVYSFGGKQGDIILRSGDWAYFYPGRGPKGNFRLNKCLGYIEDLAPFAPSLPKNCPLISRSEISGFSAACQDYLLSLRSCENPSANPPVSITDSACHSFLSKLNYVGCVEKYKNDSDFLTREWWVWAENRLNIFDPVHDKIQLINKAGEVVDEYIY